MKSLFNFFWGLQSDSDEVEQQRLEHIGMKGLMFIFYLNIIGLIGSFCWDISQSKLSIGTLIIFLVLYISSLYLAYMLRKEKPVSYEVYSHQEYRFSIRHSLLHSTVQGLALFVGLSVAFSLVDTYLLNEGSTIKKDIVISFCISVIYTVLLFVLYKHKIKKEY